jgi:hypothetical protein
VLGYQAVSLNLAPCLQLKPGDDAVVSVLRLLSEYSIDMLITICPRTPILTIERPQKSA